MTIHTHEIYDPGIDPELDTFVNDLCDDALKEARSEKEENPRDKTGRKIEVGDTLKIFHFTGSRRKKHYVYQYVIGKEKKPSWKRAMLKVSKLTPENEYYYIALDGSKRTGIEIVQGFAGKQSFQDRLHD